MRTRDLVTADSIPVVGQRYSVVVQDAPIIERGEMCRALCDDGTDTIVLTGEYPTTREAAAALLHEALEALEGTLQIEWLTHERIYLIADVMAGATVEGFGLDAVVAERAKAKKGKA
jgi:hypothetical protein